MIVVRQQQARRLHPLSAEEIGVIVQEVTHTVLRVISQQAKERAALAAEKPATGRGRWRHPQPEATAPRVLAIMQAACAVTGLSMEDMTSARRARRVAWPRQLAMLACVEHARHASLPQIGRAFRRDHTTVMHAVAVMRARIAEDAKLRVEYEAIVAKVAA